MKINRMTSLGAIAGLVAVGIMACGEDAAVVVGGQCFKGDNAPEGCIIDGSGGDTNDGAGGNSGGNIGGSSGSGTSGAGGSGAGNGGTAGNSGADSGGTDSGGTAGGDSGSAGGDAAGGSDTGSGGDGAGGDSSGGGSGDSGSSDSGGNDSSGGSAGSGDSGKEGGGVGDACTTTGDCSGLFVCCSGKCVDPNLDVNNCGGCGVTCGGLTPFCQVGVCTAGCSNSGGVQYAVCPDMPGVCRNVDSDNNHCGQLVCKKCKASESCVGGTCVP
jgi:hypothetical protein